MDCFVCRFVIATYYVIKNEKVNQINDTEPQIPIAVTERLKPLKQKLWENGHFKAYYSEISEVLGHLAYRYQIPTFEKQE